ncbi:MAG: 2Fe-2S iron-sulfur cluster-binding protein [Nannocystaceae bacterium]
MTGSTTRRGFLRGGVGAAIVTGACRPTAHGEVAPESTAAQPSPSERVGVETAVNGEARTLEVEPDTTALEAVRGLGLTGSKHGCGHGACGACTMLLDGQAVVTCLMPATALHRRKLRTIEGSRPRGAAPGPARVRGRGRAAVRLLHPGLRGRGQRVP